MLSLQRILCKLESNSSFYDKGEMRGEKERDRERSQVR